MTPTAIIDIVKQQFGDRITATFADDLHPRFHVDAKDWRVVAEFLIGDPRFQLDWLACHSGVDYVADGKMACVHDLWSFELRHAIAVKVFTPRDNPSIPSVADLWPAADWHEREAYDLFGIDFPGHPDLRRILCADDWKPSRCGRTTNFPREYHGIPASVELDWQHKPDYPR